MKGKILTMALASLASAIVMWVLAGLWHNLILPAFNKKIEAHHEGLVLMFAAYCLLALLITIFFVLLNPEQKTRVGGLKLGILCGIIWVLPHGLTMAAAHDTSILYEFKNALWHVFEQGIGGLVIEFLFMKRNKNYNP